VKEEAGEKAHEPPMKLASWTAAAISVTLLLIRTASAEKVGFRPGEAFTFRVTFGQMEAGRARMAVGPPTLNNRRQLIAVHGEAETSSWVNAFARVNEYYKVVFDIASLLPESILRVENGVGERRVSVLPSREGAAIEIMTKGETRKIRRIFARPARDALSALFAIRSLSTRAGDEIELDIFEGVALWRAKLRVTKKEPLTPEGFGGSPRDAWQFDGECHRIDDRGRPINRSRRHFGFWLSDDSDRLLLRAWFDAELGRMTLDLTSYDRSALQRAQTLKRDEALPGIVVTPGGAAPARP
jgi:hypothetical protein